MKTRIAVAIAALLVASLGTTAYAQGAQETTPEQTTPPTSTTTTTQSSQTTSTSTPTMSSDKVTRKVKRELRDHGVSTNDISVTFQNGTATLSGTVASQADINKAKSAAMRVRGVKHVDASALQVQGQG